MSEHREQRNPNVEDLLTNIIAANAQKDPQTRLRLGLNGKILFQMSDSGKNYIFDWSSDKLRTAAVGSPDSESNVDCFINLSEGTLQKIAAGDINPQIAMLSNKINIKGKVAFAVYIFNLLAF